MSTQSIPQSVPQSVPQNPTPATSSNQIEQGHRCRNPILTKMVAAVAIGAIVALGGALALALTGTAVALAFCPIPILAVSGALCASAAVGMTLVVGMVSIKMVCDIAKESIHNNANRRKNSPAPVTV